MGPYSRRSYTLNAPQDDVGKQAFQGSDRPPRWVAADQQSAYREPHGMVADFLLFGLGLGLVYYLHSKGLHSMGQLSRDPHVSATAAAAYLGLPPAFIMPTGTRFGAWPHEAISSSLSVRE